MADRVNNVVDLIQSLTGLVPVFSGGGTTTTNTSSLDEATKASLQQTATGDQFSKDQAIADSQGAVDAVVRTILETNFPSLASAQRGSGVFNDTTTQLLLNDLTSRAAGQGAALQQQTVKNFADIQNNAANTLKGSSTTTTQTQGPQIEDPLSALLTTGGVALGGHLFSKAGGFDGLFSALGGLFDDDDDEFATGSSSETFGTPPFNPILSDTKTDAVSALESALSLSGSTSIGGQSEAPTGTSSGGSVSGGFSTNGDAGISVDVGGLIEGITDFFGGCFITTAVCKYSGKPDDCKELETLREFRDTYMSETPERLLEVQKYYEQAPGLVQSLERIPEPLRGNIFSDLDEGYIQPAIEAIESDQPEVAYEIYKDLFSFVKEIVMQQAAA